MRKRARQGAASRAPNGGTLRVICKTYRLAPRRPPSTPRTKYEEEAKSNIQRLEGLVSSLTGERGTLTSDVQGLKEENQKLMRDASQAESARKSVEETAQGLEQSLGEAKGEVEALTKGKQEAEFEVVKLKG